MAVHDVSRELRDWHGRWARTPGLKRIATELEEARAPATLAEIDKRIRALEPGQAKGINGILVHHTDKGYKVRLSKAQGGTKFYQDPSEAALAVRRLAHHEPGGGPGPEPPRRAPEPPREPPRAPSPPREPPAAPEPPRPSPGSGLTEDEKQAVARALEVRGRLYLKDYNPSAEEHRQIIKGMAVAKEKLGADSPEHRNLVKAYRTSQLRRRKQKRAPGPAPEPEPPRAPETKFSVGAEVTYQGKNAKIVREYPGGGYLIEFEDGWRKVIRRPSELTPGRRAAPAPAPPLRPGVEWNWNSGNENIPGTREYVYNRAMENGYTSRESALMITQAMTRGQSDVNNGMYVLYDTRTGTLRLKVYKRQDIPGEIPPSREREFRGIVAPGGVVHPRSLEIARTANQGDARNKQMRQKILAATTKQAEISPDLVSRTDVAITKRPHGKTTRALASHTGQANTLHIKPEVLIGDNAQQVLDQGQASGWWSRTDKEHDLAMNVMTHEFGHGVHGEMNRLGFITANRHNPWATSPEEQEFWRGLARALGATEPEALQWDISGPEKMNIVSWHSKNAKVIASNVGQYASKNMNEMFAELWTEYRLSSTPRPAARYFGDWVSAKFALHEKAIA